LKLHHPPNHQVLFRKLEHLPHLPRTRPVYLRAEPKSPGERRPEVSPTNHRIALLLLLVAAACDPRAAPPVAEAPEATDSSGHLARDWIALFQTKTQQEAEERLRALRTTWMDRTVTWDVEVLDPFCGEGGCNVRAFDFARLPEQAPRAIGGALPRVALSPGQVTALREACQSHTPHCVVRVQGRITVLPEDTDAPLSIELEGVQLLSTRSARASEHFGRPSHPSPQRHVVDPLSSAARS